MVLADFMKYCAENNSPPIENLNSQDHNRLLLQLFNNPSIIGFNRVYSKYHEVELFDFDNYTLGSIDLVFFTFDMTPYICEVKVTISSGTGAKAQLEKYYEHIRDNFQVLPHRIYVRKQPNGHIQKEVIRPRVNDVLSLIGIY